jgi:thiamine biosynthesis lipoprotein ApbE
MTGPILAFRQGSRLTRAVAGIQLDLGGVAKGYAVDRLGRLLRARGVTPALDRVAETNRWPLGTHIAV